MKKILLILTTIAYSTLFSQALESGNFNSYTIGNLNSQGSWSRSGGDPNQVKIAEITPDIYGRSMHFPRTSPAEMWVYKSTGLQVPWINRTSGNDVAVVSVMLYTGTGVGDTAIQLYGATYKILGSVGYNAGQFFAGYTEEGKTFPTVVNLEGATAEDNTWVPITIYYFYATGKVSFKIGSTTYGPYTGIIGNPIEVDFYSGGSSGTTSAIDNYTATAVKEADLATGETSAVKSDLTIYPNPTTEFVFIRSKAKVIAAKIIDASGKTISEKTDNLEKINVSKMPNGIYFLKITLENGATHISKFIKK